VPEDQPMEAGILSRQIENAQKKVEEQNFVMRKNVLKYDDVLNRHRSRIYEQRRQVLEGEDLSDEIGSWIDEVIERTVALYTESDFQEEWDLAALCKEMEDIYATEEPITPDELREEVGLDREAIVEEFQEDARDTYQEKEKSLGLNPDTEQPLLRDVERFVVLQVVDTRWREHLDNMDYLREGVHLRAMAQKDPLVEYTTEGEAMFRELGLAIREEVVRTLFHAQIEVEEVDQLQQAQAAQGLDGGAVSYGHESLAGAEAIAAAGAGALVGGNGGSMAGSLDAGGGSVATQQRVVSDRDKIGRNDPCWCGSGKKFKRCHGA
jgi:preprotein translocase subunit SecA